MAGSYKDDLKVLEDFLDARKGTGPIAIPQQPRRDRGLSSSSGGSPGDIKDSSFLVSPKNTVASSPKLPPAAPQAPADGDQPTQQSGKGKQNNPKSQSTGSQQNQQKGQQQQQKQQQQQQQKNTSQGAQPSGQPAKSNAPAKPKMKAPPAPKQFDDTKKKRDDKKKVVQLVPVAKKVALFSHLPQYERYTSKSLNLKGGGEIHPAIIRLGLKYAHNVIRGSTARAMALLDAFKQVITDYTTPPQKSLHRDLDQAIKPMIQFLADCRPLSISMGNVINYMKLQIAATSSMSEEEAKEFLIQQIDGFIQERIVVANDAIASYGVSKITDGDVILTYASSYAVETILSRALKEGRQFRVIVVDSRPSREGKELLRRIAQQGVQCTYVLINAVSYIMKDVSKVFLGAYACLSNGNVISRVGTAIVSMMAHAYHVPVLVCCETFKFCERVQLDSICFNELCDPDELMMDDVQELEKLKDWKDVPTLKLLNLAYDLTPITFVAMVVTEVGMIPPTSVPVVIREYYLDRANAGSLNFL